MSETISGVIEYIGQKNGFWNIKLDDEQWYGFGKYEPKCNKGDTIEFDVEYNGKYANAVNKTLNVLERAQRGGGGSSRGGSSSNSRGQSGGNSGYREGRTSPRDEGSKPYSDVHKGAAGNKPAWDEGRQNSIVFQSARKDALEFVKLLGTLNLMELKGSKSEQMGIVELYVAKFTDQFYNDTSELKASTPNFDKSDKVRKAPEPEAVKTTTSAAAKPRGRPPAKSKAPEYEAGDGNNDDPAFDDDIPFGRD